METADYSGLLVVVIYFDTMLDIWMQQARTELRSETDRYRTPSPVTEPFINCEMHRGFSLRSEGLRAISHWSCCLIASSIVQVLQTSNRPPLNQFYTMRGSATVVCTVAPAIYIMVDRSFFYLMPQSAGHKPPVLESEDLPESSSEPPLAKRRSI